MSVITHRSVLAVAMPIMLSNVSEPLIGVVNTAVLGQLPEPYYIGAITVGSLIFSFLFWGFGFLRLSTGGLSAQATGAGDTPELIAVLARALGIAVAAGLVLIILSPLIGKFVFDLMGGSAEVRHHAEIYYNYRIWSAPFALANYCFIGWFIGQGRSVLTFAVQLVLNLTNMGLSILFVMGFGMTSAGVGLAALLAEVTASILGLAFVLVSLRRMNGHVSWPAILDGRKFWRTLAMNGDIMIRTLCLVFAFSWMTARGARQGDIILAGNTILLHFFGLSAFLIDGFAYASEALVGQAVGARSRERFWRSIRLTSFWAAVVGVTCAVIIWLTGPWLIDLMSVNPEVRETARRFLPWCVLTPILGAASFQFDGIYSGAMATKEMRNMMIVSLAIFLAAWWLLETRFGNHGLWAALNIFFVARGLTFASRMPSLERRAFQAL